MCLCVHGNLGGCQRGIVLSMVGWGAGRKEKPEAIYKLSHN